MKIIKTKYGIASRVGDDIFINKELLKYPKLYWAILDHEMSHTSGWTLHDLKIDLTNKHLNGLKKDYYNFILTHPKSWTEFLPINLYKGNVSFNLTLIIFYSLFLIFGGLIWSLIHGVF